MTDLSVDARLIADPPPRQAEINAAVAAPLLATVLLAACASGPVMPPSVSYHVPDHNVAITSDEAQNYCVQFDRVARYQGLETRPDGLVAVYTCDGPASAGAAAPPQ
ncbi:MAG: hypothetical protein ACLQJR_14240 [Stellaceae bacterium]